MNKQEWLDSALYLIQNMPREEFIQALKDCGATLQDGTEYDRKRRLIFLIERFQQETAQSVVAELTESNGTAEIFAKRAVATYAEIVKMIEEEFY